MYPGLRTIRLVETTIYACILCVLLATGGCKQDPLPESYGVFVVDNGNLRCLDDATADVGPGARFVLFDKSISHSVPKEGEIKRLSLPAEYVEGLAAGSIKLPGSDELLPMPPIWGNREEQASFSDLATRLRAWRNWKREDISYRVQPVEGKAEMVRLVPTKALEPGIYDLGNAKFYVTVSLESYKESHRKFLGLWESPGTELPYVAEIDLANVAESVGIGVADASALQQAFFHKRSSEAKAAIEREKWDEAANLARRALQIKKDPDFERFMKDAPFKKASEQARLAYKAKDWAQAQASASKALSLRADDDEMRRVIEHIHRSTIAGHSRLPVGFVSCSDGSIVSATQDEVMFSSVLGRQGKALRNPIAMESMAAIPRRDVYAGCKNKCEILYGFRDGRTGDYYVAPIFEGAPPTNVARLCLTGDADKVLAAAGEWDLAQLAKNGFNRLKGLPAGEYATAVAGLAVFMQKAPPNGLYFIPLPERAVNVIGSPTGRQTAVVLQNGDIMVLRSSTGERLARITRPAEARPDWRAVLPADDLLSIGGQGVDGKLRILDYDIRTLGKTGEIVLECPRHLAGWARGRNCVALWDGDKLRLYESQSRQLLLESSEHVTTVSFSADDAFVAAGGPSGELIVFGLAGLVAGDATSHPANASRQPAAERSPVTAPSSPELTIRQPSTHVVDLGGGVEMILVQIPPGSFDMGSEAESDERPAHKVKISKPFYLGRYEVTQEQWQAVMGSNPSRSKNKKNPVDSVSWTDCQEFLSRLNAKVKGYSFRLPTEAEWEYACRAGINSRFYFGDNVSGLDEYAWFSNNAGGGTHPVGQKQPNAWGLYDMHGNVWEWCADWHGSYSQASQTDPKGPESGSKRVLRGNSWAGAPSDCRSAFRSAYDSGDHYVFCGLRVAAEVTPLTSQPAQKDQHEALPAPPTTRAVASTNPVAAVKQPVVSQQLRDNEVRKRLSSPVQNTASATEFQQRETSDSNKRSVHVDTVGTIEKKLAGAWVIDSAELRNRYFLEFARQSNQTVEQLKKTPGFQERLDAAVRQTVESVSMKLLLAEDHRCTLNGQFQGEAAPTARGRWSVQGNTVSLSGDGLEPFVFVYDEPRLMLKPPGLPAGVSLLVPLKHERAADE